jgi:flagellar basal-body rod modification protein FlgD
MIDPVTNTVTRDPTGAGKGNALENLNTSQFLDLMIAELQNQDPMNPMDNAQMIEQIGQIRSIDASSRLSKTLDSVLMGQNLATASSLIGKTISGLDTDSDKITGVVERVTVADGVPKLHVNGKQVDLKNVGEILPTETEA